MNVIFPNIEGLTKTLSFYPIKLNRYDSGCSRGWIEIEKNDKNKKLLLNKLFDLLKEYPIEDVLVRQLVFDLYHHNALTYMPENEALEYITKLKDAGMKFYWSHILPKVAYDRDRKDRNFIQTYNDLIIGFGIVNPNQRLYSDLIDEKGKSIYGDRYLPLIGFQKLNEGFLQYGWDLNLLDLKNSFDTYLRAGCSPFHISCSHYNSHSFPVNMSEYANPSFSYTVNEVTNCNLDVTLTESDLDDETEHGINEMNSRRYLKDRGRNMALVKFILHVVFEYEKLGFIVDELSFPVERIRHAFHSTGNK